MRHLPRITVALLCTLFVAIGHADTLIGKVVGVTDGDTITVLDERHTQHKIRLAGIDAPERAQPFGQRAKQHLSGLVFGHLVVVEYDKQDRYRRTVGKVVVEGRDANLAMVVAGYAWHYKKYQNEQDAADRLLYANAEFDAREQLRGLWAQQSVAPWDWRAGRRGD